MSYTTGLLICCLLIITSCKDDALPVNASIVGVWAGNKVDFDINPKGVIPAFTVSEDNFPVQLEFKGDGVLILSDQTTTTAGTYQINGRTLNINIDYEFELIGLTGTYGIEELTATSLRAATKREGAYTHPETGQTFNGEVKATLFFERQTD